MKLAVDILLLLLAVLAAVPAVFVLLETLAATLPARRSTPSRTTSPPTCAVLVPAHNEQAAVAATIAAIRPQLRTGDRLIVIADNCTDGTAVAARNAGAQAIERADAANRGKGHALAFGVDHLRNSESGPPDVVIVIDADCDVAPGSLDALTSQAVTTGRPAQGIDLLDPPANAGPRDLISSMAFTFKNLARPSGLQRFNLPCLLMGTGMGIPWQQIQGAALASGNIVEDMKLGVDLAIAGHGPRLCLNSCVRGRLPESGKASTTQRTRWEHGHIHTILSQGPRVLLAAVRQRRFDLLVLALELCVPPLALLVLLTGTLAAVGAAWGLLGGSWLPAGTAAVSLALLGIAVGLAWFLFARGTIPLFALLFAPMYALIKIPLYVLFVFKRQKAWVRTARTQAGNPDGPTIDPHAAP